jgi:Arc-like DNA binding domain
MTQNRSPHKAVLVRMPFELYDRLVEQCQGSPRNSVNREIIQRLYESLKAERDADAIEELKARVAQLEAERVK